jgi:biopolymer transport protein ExbD
VDSNRRCFFVSRVDVATPCACAQPRPENIQLALRATGALYWNGEPVERAALAERMRAAASANPQPELHIRADGAIEYRHVGEILGHAARAGLDKVGFVSDPKEPAP